MAGEGGGVTGGEDEEGEGDNDELNLLPTQWLLLLLRRLRGMLLVGMGGREAAARRDEGGAAATLLPAANPSLRSPQPMVAPLLIWTNIIPVSYREYM